VSEIKPVQKKPITMRHVFTKLAWISLFVLSIYLLFNIIFVQLAAPIENQIQLLSSIHDETTTR
jgi:hypothetical protein